MSPSVYSAGILCSLVAVASYINTLDCGLCFDDNPGIVKNQDLRPYVSWANLLWDDFWGTPMGDKNSHKSYRPLCVATFRLNYLLHELQPMGYHLVNVLLHSAVCYLYVQLCGVIFSAVWPALIAGLLFAVHPIHTEAVSVSSWEYMYKGRHECICHVYRSLVWLVGLRPCLPSSFFYLSSTTVKLSYTLREVRLTFETVMILS